MPLHENQDLLIDDDLYPEEYLKMFDEMRMMSYYFPAEFLSKDVISNTITFKVGDL